jgi:hypothetical protein
MWNRWKYNNCLLWAILEAIKDNQYIVIRKTKHHHRWPFCKFHFLVLPKKIVDVYARSYVPKKETLGKWPPPFFRGYEKDGDD